MEVMEDSNFWHWGHPPVGKISDARLCEEELKDLAEDSEGDSPEAPSSALSSKFGCGGQNRFGIPFWLAREFTTHFRLYVSGWIGYDLDFDP